MMKKYSYVLCSLVLLGCLTSCSNEDNSSNQFVSPEPEIKQIETVNNDNNLASNKEENEKSEINNDVINSKAKDFTSLIPAGWHILEHTEPVKAEGDLNKDGIQDLAIVIEKTQEENDPPRSLLIAFGNKDHTFSLSTIAVNVILGALEGGGWGDPFDGIIINRGSVVVSDFGGSGQRWYDKYRFRFQEHDWQLIGVTRGWNHSIKLDTEMAFDEEDYNLLTGDYIFDKINENGEEKITRENRGKKLVKLSEFNINEIPKYIEIEGTKCYSNEDLVISFDIRNSSKSLIVCVSAQADYIVYRFGMKNHVELEYPEDKTNSWTNFTYNYYLRGGGPGNEGLDLNSLSFTNNGFKYEVYENYSAVDDKTDIGVKITDPNTNKETDLNGVLSSKSGSLISLRDTILNQEQ
jgi:hypothetical protein